MTCPFSRQDGAYLLGALSPQERRTYEEHLGNCPICSAALSEVAGLPGLLARLPAEAVEVTDPPPADLLPALLRAVQSERGRSRRRVRITTALAAAAAVAAIAVLGTAVVQANQPTQSVGSTAAAAPVSLTRVKQDVPLRATAALLDKPWGTEVDLRCTYSGVLDKTYDLVLVAVDRAGKGEQIAVWEVVSTGEARVIGSTSLRSAELAAVEVRNAKGETVLRLQR